MQKARLYIHVLSELTSKGYLHISMDFKINFYFYEKL